MLEHILAALEAGDRKQLEFIKLSLEVLITQSEVFPLLETHDRERFSEFTSFALTQPMEEATTRLKNIKTALLLSGLQVQLRTPPPSTHTADTIHAMHAMMEQIEKVEEGAPE